MHKKVNCQAVCKAIMEQAPILHLHVKVLQFQSIAYICPGLEQYDVEDIVGFSLRLTRKWNTLDVIAMETDYNRHMPVFIVSSKDLLPEFIVEGEEWVEEQMGWHGMTPKRDE